MSVGTYRYGERPVTDGLFIGVTRYRPRGVVSNSSAIRACYDVWLPLLAPSRELLRAYHKGLIGYASFAAKFRHEMSRPDPRHVIETLAAVSQRQPILLGCYCADESQCHRLLLQALFADAQPPSLQPPTVPQAISRYSSPACAMSEIDD